MNGKFELEFDGINIKANFSDDSLLVTLTTDGALFEVVINSVQFVVAYSSDSTEFTLRTTTENVENVVETIAKVLSESADGLVLFGKAFLREDLLELINEVMEDYARYQARSAKLQEFAQQRLRAVMLG